MSQDETSLSEEEVAVDDAEASEAAGVASIEMAAPELPPEDAAALDSETLDGLEGPEREELEEAAGGEGLEPGSVRLSANFVLAEFHCCRGHCPRASVPGNAVPALRRLVRDALQPMRNRFGRCEVNSGFRNKQHNKHVGGEDNSFHRYDVRPHAPAADVTFTRGSVNEWATEARRLLGNIGGIGRYPSQNFVHVDLGPKRKWDG